jgi:NitT/TauT family transport system permease protein
MSIAQAPSTGTDTPSPTLSHGGRGGFGAADAAKAWQGWLALLLLVFAAFAPVSNRAGEPGGDPGAIDALLGGPVSAGWIAILGAFALIGIRAAQLPGAIGLAIGSTTGAVYAIGMLDPLAGQAGAGFWAFLAASWLLAWLMVDRLAAWEPRNRLLAALVRILVPLLVGIWVLVLWECIVRGFGVLPVILPAPSGIGRTIAKSISFGLGGGFPFIHPAGILWDDFRQTFMKSVLAGYAIGCSAGFLVAVLIDRVPFLRRGLLPIGSLVSALPIIGVAPIMVMWFGFDWPSKAAVVVVMTFFPMLVNTVAGLGAAGRMERDLMHTYAAGYITRLIKLRLPAALPFIFNALKINSTLALIGAIVAEFFGTPIQGMGFRISAAVGRLDIELVWAEIAVAALAGTIFYGVMALLERVFTFWHPSFRS